MSSFQGAELGGEDGIKYHATSLTQYLDVDSVMLFWGMVIDGFTQYPGWLLWYLRGGKIIIVMWMKEKQADVLAVHFTLSSGKCIT